MRRLAWFGIAATLVTGPGCSCGSDSPRLPAADAAPSADAIVSGDAAVADRPAVDGGGGCDPVSGEGCPCATLGEVRSCQTEGVGACGTGTQECVVEFEFQAWGPCGDAPAPSDEECDGVDNDCDGDTDEGISELSCGTGTCAVTMPGCLNGVPQQCLPDQATDEACDGLDNDCDGSTDEELGTLTCGMGECAREVAACEDAIPGNCVPGSSADETCDDLDNDCDGSIDEDQGTLSCGMGACRRTVQACADGAPQTCTPGTGTTETCDGIDNDCDGTIDNGFGTVVCGVGECERVVVECGGGTTPDCTPGEPGAEVCDDLDNDCDGSTDEEIPDVTCGTGACRRTEPGCVGGEPNECTPGSPDPEACDGVDNDCDGTIDEELGVRTCGQGACRRSVQTCVDGSLQTCTPGSASPEECGDGIDDDCDGTVDNGCDCDPTVDTDFDGFSECTDCDDTNGARYPGRTETCDGIDEDCDGLIDETFDQDGDTYSTCSDDPLLRDCDDNAFSVNPGAPEQCGPDGTGNDVDDNCNGFVDETCAPCTDTDEDGDGHSECEGDCDDGDAAVFPGQAEICDGLDNDCNVFTVQNCDVSESCNFESEADVCEDDLLCVCVLENNQCRGNFICTSFCQGSYTGPLGAGCTDSQVCVSRLLNSANVHGCTEYTSGSLGMLRGGAECSAASECRSGTCTSAAPFSPTTCFDHCDHDQPNADGACADGALCRVLETSSAMVAACGVDAGGNDTGGACTTSGGPFRERCRYGDGACVGGVCAEPCGLESHCPSGTHCSFLGNGITTGTYSEAPVAGETAVETVPVCLTDTGTGQHNRQAGAACSQNSDCISQFCDSGLRVCLSPCTSDDTCPTGLVCELQFVRVPSGVTQARVCVTARRDDDVFEPL